MLQYIVLQRVGHNLMTEQQQPMPEGPCPNMATDFAVKSISSACRTSLLKCCLATSIFRYCGQVFRLGRTQSYTQLWVGLGISSLVLMEQWERLVTASTWILADQVPTFSTQTAPTSGFVHLQGQGDGML